MPVLCYGCEAWNSAQKITDMIDISERKVQKIRNWFMGVKHSNKFYLIYKEIPVLKSVWTQRLCWVRHIVRKDGAVEDIYVMGIGNKELEEGSDGQS